MSCLLLFNATDKLKTFLPGNLIKNGKELQKDKITNRKYPYNMLWAIYITMLQIVDIQDSDEIQLG